MATFRHKILPKEVWKTVIFCNICQIGTFWHPWVR